MHQYLLLRELCLKRRFPGRLDESRLRTFTCWIRFEKTFSVFFVCLCSGGLSGFRQSHENLCEHSLHLDEGLDSGAAAGLAGALPHSLPSTPDIENAELTPILPFLYLGNEPDAQDLNLLQRFHIRYILNVTTHLPLYHYDTGLFVYKRLPVTDSNKQNLRQYFEEAFEFIGTV